MALEAGNLVYSNLNSGLMAYAPLFGTVVYTDGVNAPDLILVNWESGASQFYESDVEDTSRLKIYTQGTSELVGKRRIAAVGDSKYQVIVLRQIVVGGVKHALVRTYRPFGPNGFVSEVPLYAMVLETDLSIG